MKKRRRNATAQKTLDRADATRRGRGEEGMDRRRRGGGRAAADIMGRVRPPDRLTDFSLFISKVTFISVNSDGTT